MRLQLTNFGPIKSADVELSDLTVLVGPQATGKSIFVQTVKLLLDIDDIQATVRRHGYVWQNDAEFLTLYYGDGLGSIWNKRTRVRRDGESISRKKLLGPKRGKARAESVFVVPAQRVLTLRRGWPRPFTEFDYGDPYVVRKFSEDLRRLMEQGLGSEEGILFPRANRLKRELRDSVEDSIFHGASLNLDHTRGQKQVVIRQGDAAVQYMAWSAGQREFVPLLFGLYWLMPSGGTNRRRGTNWVIIEEPEMGLHPRAVSSTLLLVLELLRRGYKVILSTHSTQVLDLVWALRLLQAHEAEPDKLLNIFDLRPTRPLLDMAASALSKSVGVHAFEIMAEGVSVRNISALDPDSDDDLIANWGGLMGFADNAAEVVAAAVADHLSRGLADG